MASLRQMVIARNVLLFLLSLGTLINSIITTYFGAFLVCFAAYKLVPVYTTVKPLSWHDVIEFVLSQNPDRLVAGAGILIGYHVAVEAWKKQKQYEVKLDAYRDISAFVRAFADEANLLERFASSLDAIQQQSAMNPKPELYDASVTLALKTLPKAEAARESLGERRVALHGLRTKHETAISHSLVASWAFNRLISHVEAIGDEIWFVMPVGAQSEEEFVRRVCSYVPTRWARYRRISNENVPKMLSTWAGVEGVLLGRIFPPNLSSLLRFKDTSRFILDEADE